MVSTRRAVRNNSFERKVNDEGSQSSKTRKPLPDPPSILHVITIVLLHLCKNIVFFNTQVRILAYLTCLFALSSIADVSPMPKMFFPNINYFLNQYFVKIGWFWTLAMSVPFVFMTSYTYCCGKKGMVLKHLARLAVATIFWFVWVSFFVYIEGLYGSCHERRDLKSKYACLRAASKWTGFDLSGHTFILIYSNLILIEEARPILGWEGIADLIRDESHSRDNNVTSYGPLRGLNVADFDKMRILYLRFLPYVRFNFVLVTLISIIWDIMLLSTIIYFHSMPEKLISGIIAIATWFITYRVCYGPQKLSPGVGSFQYFTADDEEKKPINVRRSSRRSSLS